MFINREKICKFVLKIKVFFDNSENIIGKLARSPIIAGSLKARLLVSCYFLAVDDDLLLKPML